VTPHPDSAAARAIILSGCLTAVSFFAAGFVFALLLLTILVRWNRG
jgi:tetrahydromethanopterin S-methyltransferase subunit F